MKKMCVALCAVAAVGTAVSSASADIVTSLAAFQAAIGNDPGQFNNDCNQGSGTVFSGGSPSMTQTVSAPGGIYHSGAFLGVNNAGDAFTVTFSGGPVYAVGGEWFMSNISDAFVPGQVVTLTYSDGTVDVYTPGAADEFRGYISNVPLTSVVMSAGAAGTGSFAGSGTIITSSVAAPAPGAAALIGLAGLGMSRRRR